MGLGDLFKRLFQKSAEAATLPATEYRGYLITPTPQRAGSEYYTCGLISESGKAEPRTARFIRADRHGTAEQAQQHAIQKGRQIIDEQGDALFQSGHL